MKQLKGMSTEPPRELDWITAEDMVIVRENITSAVVNNERFYYYDEIRYTQTEFISSHFEQLRADLDYLSMMAEVDL